MKLIPIRKQPITNIELFLKTSDKGPPKKTAIEKPNWSRTGSVPACKRLKSREERMAGRAVPRKVLDIPRRLMEIKAPKVMVHRLSVILFPFPPLHLPQHHSTSNTTILEDDRYQVLSIISMCPQEKWDFIFTICRVSADLPAGNLSRFCVRIWAKKGDIGGAGMCIHRNRSSTSFEKQKFSWVTDTGWGKQVAG